MENTIRTAAFSIILSCAVLGCSKEMPSPAPDGTDGYAEAKIINTPAEAAEGSILVCLDGEGAAGALSGALPEDIDSLLAAYDAVSFERVIPYDVRHEESYRKYGLDRWYRVTFAPDFNPELVAPALARLNAVDKVQYNTRMKRTSDLKSYAPVAGMASASSPLSFNDPYLKDQWHYYNPGDMALSTNARAGADVNVKDAWRLTAGDPDVIVAVLDEGVQYTHPDLAANMWTNPDVNDDRDGYKDDLHGYNFVAKSGQITWDKPGDSGHGTHVAGTIAAVNNNGIGVCGIAGGSSGNGSDGVRIMSCQVFDGTDGGTTDISSEAIIYAANMGASILQCSFGSLAGTVTNDADYENRAQGIEAQALNYFLDNAGCDAIDGGIAIFASGNESQSMAAYPGAYRRLVSVTAIGCDNLPANYTNYGYGCDIAAPGGEYYTGSTYSESTCILSTMPTEPIDEVGTDGQPTGSQTVPEYGYMQGTSMACPHVSGVAALGLSYALKMGRHYTQDQFMSLLLTSVNDIDHLLSGSKRTMYNNSISQMPLSPFKGKMGSGTIDAWRLLMQIEGTPVVTVKVGQEQGVSLEEFFGGGASSVLLNSPEVKPLDIDEMNAIGLLGQPYVKYGKLYIHPTRIGSVKITVSALVGGDSENASDTPSGQRVTREVSIMARANVSENGGWL